MKQELQSSYSPYWKIASLVKLVKKVKIDVYLFVEKKTDSESCNVIYYQIIS